MSRNKKISTNHFVTQSNNSLITDQLERLSDSIGQLFKRIKRLEEVARHLKRTQQSKQGSEPNGNQTLRGSKSLKTNTEKITEVLLLMDLRLQDIANQARLHVSRQEAGKTNQDAEYYSSQAKETQKRFVIDTLNGYVQQLQSMVIEKGQLNTRQITKECNSQHQRSYEHWNQADLGIGAQHRGLPPNENEIEGGDSIRIQEETRKKFAEYYTRITQVADQIKSCPSLHSSEHSERESIENGAEIMDGDDMDYNSEEDDYNFNNQTKK